MGMVRLLLTGLLDILKHCIYVLSAWKDSCLSSKTVFKASLRPGDRWLACGSNMDANMSSTFRPAAILMRRTGAASIVASTTLFLSCCNRERNFLNFSFIFFIEALSLR